jgi:hypothetical protein
VKPKRSTGFPYIDCVNAERSGRWIFSSWAVLFLSQSVPWCNFWNSTESAETPEKENNLRDCKNPKVPAGAIDFHARKS